MEHELFQSLRASVDGTLVSDIIRSSSSGENSHRMAAMELILESSIQGRRERMLAKVRDSLQPDPTPQPKKKSQAPNTSTQEVQPPTPAPTPQSLGSPPNASTDITTKPGPATAKCESSQGSSTPTQSVTKTKKAARREEPPEDDRKNPPPSEDLVRLICRGCNVRQSRRHLRSGIYCSECLEPSYITRCAGCGTTRVDDVKTCTGCRRKFK